MAITEDKGSRRKPKVPVPEAPQVPSLQQKAQAVRRRIKLKSTQLAGQGYVSAPGAQKLTLLQTVATNWTAPINAPIIGKTTIGEELPKFGGFAAFSLLQNYFRANPPGMPTIPSALSSQNPFLTKIAPYAVPAIQKANLFLTGASLLGGSNPIPGRANTAPPLQQGQYTEMWNPFGNLFNATPTAQTNNFARGNRWTLGR